MRHAPRGRLAPLAAAAALLLAPAAQARHKAHAPATPSAEATRRQIEQAEHDRAAQQAAQKAAQQRAQAAQEQEQRLTAQRVAAAARLRAAEEATEKAATRMHGLVRRRQAVEADLAARGRDLAPMLPLMQRLSAYPAETLLAVPLPPDKALRGLLVLHGLSGELERQAEALRAEQEKLDRLRQEIAAEAPRLQAAQAAQAAEEAALDRQIAAARASGRTASAAASDAAKRAEEDATRADTLRALLGRIEAEAQRQKKAAEEARRRAAQAQVQAQQAALVPPGTPTVPGHGVVPVVGKVVRHFGQDTKAGQAVGMSIQPPPRARVVSPCRGTVDFSGPFRSFGPLLILDCGAGYHFVLAGLGRLDVQVGHSVQTGEPVGVMPDWDPATPGSRPALYVELRHDGQPVDPARWFHAGAGSGDGGGT